jgi:hypothetical protein
MKQVRIVKNIYGYLVCLIGIIVILFTLPLFLESIIDLSKPDYSNRKPYILNQSFEYWKTTSLYQFCGKINQEDIENCILPSEEKLLSMYNEEKTMARAVFVQETILVLIQRVILMIVTIVLFILHWKWLKRINLDKIEE